MYEEAKKYLCDVWDQQVQTGCMSEADMRESLEDQISGRWDMSMEELDDQLVEILGWGFYNPMPWATWRDIVDAAATKWLKDHQ